MQLIYMWDWEDSVSVASSKASKGSSSSARAQAAIMTQAAALDEKHAQVKGD